MRRIKRGPDIKYPDRPFDDVERDIIRADMAYLIQQEKENGDWAKWEESQKPFEGYNRLRSETLSFDSIPGLEGIIVTVSISPMPTFPITIEMFREFVGGNPSQDDMVRVNCPEAGRLGHQSCGWCSDCNKPRYMCGHILSRRP